MKSNMCDQCMHDKVCALKDKYKVMVNELSSQYKNDIDGCFELSLNCNYFHQLISNRELSTILSGGTVNNDIDNCISRSVIRNFDDSNTGKGS